jgi:hypothetical protein
MVDAPLQVAVSMPESHAMGTQLPCHKVLAENCVCRALRLLKVTGTSRLRSASSSGIRKSVSSLERRAAKLLGVYLCQTTSE